MSVNADSSEVGSGYIKESTFGTTPSSPAFKTIRAKGYSGLGAKITTAVSEEITSDAQITDLHKTNEEAGGGFSAELSFEAHDDLLEGAMRSVWTKMPLIENSAADTEITAVTDSSDTFTVASGGGDYVAGMLAKTTGFTNSANNTMFRVGSSSATTIVGPTLSLTDEAAPPLGAKIQVVGFEGAADDIDASATGLTSTSLDFTTLNLVSGMWVNIGGTATANKFTTAANNGWCRISDVAANTLTFDVRPSGWSSETSSGSIELKVWSGDYMRNGVQKHSYSIERRFESHDPTSYEVSTGMSVSDFSLSIPQSSFIDATFSFIGKSSSYSTTRTSGATTVAAPTNKIMNSSSDIAQILENGSVVSTPNFVTDLSCNFNSNTRSQGAVGETGLVGVGYGSFEVTGSLSTYFGDITYINKLKNQTETSLNFILKDDSSHALLFDMPRVLYTQGEANIDGQSSDITLPLDYQAVKHATLGYTVHAQRFWYYE